MNPIQYQIAINNTTYTFRPYDRDLGKTIIIETYFPFNMDYIPDNTMKVSVEIAEEFYNNLIKQTKGDKADEQ